MKALKILVVVMLATCAFAQKANPRAIIEKEIAKYIKAFEKKDIKAATEVMASNYKETTKSGKVITRKQAVDQITQVFAHAKKIKTTSTIQSLKMEKSNAHIVCHNILDVEFPMPGGKVSILHSDSVTDEIWVPSGSSFKIQSSKAVKSSQTFNGKPVPGG